MCQDSHTAWNWNHQKAKKILVVVSGEDKAEAVKNAFSGSKATGSRFYFTVTPRL
jgi:hypothetical protein